MNHKHDLSTDSSPRPPESVVLLLQGTSENDHPGVVDGYRRLVVSGNLRHLRVLPVFGPRGTQRGQEFWDEVLEEARVGNATCVVFQYYHHPELPDPRPAIRRLKELPTHPIVVSTLGDPFMNGYGERPKVPRSFLQAAEESNLVTLTSMGRMADYVTRFAKAPVLLSPHAVCQVRFSLPTEQDMEETPEFDVAFIGSRNSSRNPLRPYHRMGRNREELVQSLTKRFGERFAVFGRGWEGHPADRGPVDFRDQHHAARRARVLVGGIPFSRARYYMSNRPFIQISSGVHMVDVAVEGVETLLRPGQHWELVAKGSIIEAVEAALRIDPAVLRRRGSAAANYVFGRHTQAHRVAALVENARRVRSCRDGGLAMPPHLPFFLPEVDQSVEARQATRNWPGV